MSSRYEPLHASKLPVGVRFDVPGRNQGQIVEIAYGGFSRYAHDHGDPYQRITDLSLPEGAAGRVRYLRRVKP